MKPPKIICFIDDDKAILNVLEYTLSSLKEWEIHTFKTGESFFGFIDKNPDIVVLDYVLNIHENTSMNGFDVLRKIKKLKPSTKVIILSYIDDPEVINKFIEEGADSFIKKEAFFIDELITRLDKISG